MVDAAQLPRRGNKIQEVKDMNKKNVLKMAIGMAACCLVPALIVLAVSVFGIASGSRAVSSIVPFLCPIMMIGMMLFMGMGNRHSHNHEDHGDHSCCHSEGQKDGKPLRIE